MRVNLYMTRVMNEGQEAKAAGHGWALGTGGSLNSTLGARSSSVREFNSVRGDASVDVGHVVNRQCPLKAAVAHRAPMGLSGL